MTMRTIIAIACLGLLLWVEPAGACEADTPRPPVVYRLGAKDPNWSSTAFKIRISDFGTSAGFCLSFRLDVGRADHLRPLGGSRRVRGDDLKRSATDAGDTLVTGALHSRCQLLANACMASHKATRGLDLAEPRPSSALGGVCAVQLVAGEAARHVAARFPPPMPLLH